MRDARWLREQMGELLPGDGLARSCGTPWIPVESASPLPAIRLLGLMRREFRHAVDALPADALMHFDFLGPGHFAQWNIGVVEFRDHAWLTRDVTHFMPLPGIGPPAVPYSL